LNSLETVEAELKRYHHPLVLFTAREMEGGDGVDVLIRLRDAAISSHTYTIRLAPRDLENPRFSWAFQRILYDSLHDYMIELFNDRP
jgi:hypothetical protein